MREDKEFLKVMWNRIETAELEEREREVILKRDRKIRLINLTAVVSVFLITMLLLILSAKEIIDIGLIVFGGIVAIVFSIIYEVGSNNEKISLNSRGGE